jgi:hypothetical membrane protein
MFSPFLTYSAFGGTVVVLLAVLCAALAYRGKRGERYSPLNHFISELGEVGVSRQARIFNTGLIVGGLLLLPFVIRLGLVLDSPLGWVGMIFGAAAALGVTAVGLFPMNRLQPHVLAAMTFFRAGLGMVFFFGLAAIFQPAEQVAVPKTAALLSLLAVLAFGSFLALPRLKKPANKPLEILDPELVPERPRFWALPFLEWLVFFATILWLFGMALLV